MTAALDELRAAEARARRATNGTLKAVSGYDADGRALFQYQARRPRGSLVVGPASLSPTAAIAGFLDEWNRNRRRPKPAPLRPTGYDLYGLDPS